MDAVLLTRAQLLSEARQWDMAAQRVGGSSKLDRATSRAYRAKARESRAAAERMEKQS